MKKKVLSLILALLMTASAASAVLADETAAIADAEETAAVEEVVEAGQYDKAIEFLNNYGIFKGKSADDLGAEDMLERYQMALFVARISTGWVDDEKWEDGPENWSEFDDISEGPVANYWGALSYANSKGIIEGYGNGKFGPTDGITYQNALTMVVRTLGYQGLEWPWGYIEKAVSLGLTDGITGVAYQDELNRGEVAQILYNALFATTKNGTTLALSSFGIEFGWEKVVITASDLNTFVADKEGAAKRLEADDLGYNYWKDSNKTEDGYVSFQILNDDGSLADDVYYVAGKDIGLSGEDNAHDDEAVVGDAYYMLFEKDADSELVNLVSYEPLLVDTIWNSGKTDDDGEAQEYAIQEFLADYSLVSKYSTNGYANIGVAGAKNEMIVFNATSNLKEVEVTGKLIAIDWETGDILQAKLDDDGDVIYDEDGFVVYETAWYYNETLKKYYQYNYITNKDDDPSDEDIYGINYMTDAEFEDWYEDLADVYDITKTHNYNGFNKPVSKIAKSAYASLKVYDTNIDGVADRGVYETYRLGYFDKDVVWCGKCGANLESYRISDVNPFGNAQNAVKANNEYNENRGYGVTDETLPGGGFEIIVEGVACSNEHKDHNQSRAWIVEGYEPMVAYDEDGEEDGYVDGSYVIYNYDAETGAIKVVKNIADESDADTYVAKGVVRAYNLKNGTITIGETQYEIDNYDELLGNGFRYATANWATRACYTAALRNLFNQFVEYVVVDGELAAIKAAGSTKSELIIVDSYAGLSNDGYIVVNGYSTSDLEYTQFRIGSYNGWQQGDYYYYMTEKKAAESFKKGTIYGISSYDADEDVYYVQLVAEWDKDEKEYVVEEDEYVNLYNITIEGVEDGRYFEYTKHHDKDKMVSLKTQSSDKYIIIPAETTNNAPYAPIYVYEGKIPEGWTVTGDRINSDDHNNRTYVIVNATDIEGFDKDTYKSGLVLLLDDKYLSANYNGADSDSWYLLGASAYEVEVFDLLTGSERVTYAGTNVDLDEGHIYYTQDGVIVEDLGVWDIALQLPLVALDVYSDTNPATADYLFGTVVITDDNYEDFIRSTDDKRREYVAGLDATYFDENANVVNGTLDEQLGNDKYRDVVDDIYVYAVDYKDDVVKDVVTINSKTAKFEDLVEDYDEFAFPAYYVYDLSTDNIVYYISLAEADITTVVSDDLDWTNPVVIKDMRDFDTVEAYIQAEVAYQTVTTTTNGVEEVTALVDGIKLSFEGVSVDDASHENVLANGWFFATTSDCAYDEDGELVLGDNVVADIVLDGDNLATIYGVQVLETYGEHNDDNCDCELVKSIYIPLRDLQDPDNDDLAEYMTRILEDDETPVEIKLTLTDSVAGDADFVSSGSTPLDSVWVDLWTTPDSTTTVETGFNPGEEVTVKSLEKLVYLALNDASK